MLANNRNEHLKSDPSGDEVTSIQRNTEEIRKRLQQMAMASRDILGLLKEQHLASEALGLERMNARDREGRLIEQKKHLESLEVANQATLQEIRRANQIEVESIKNHARTRIHELVGRLNDLQNHSNETIRSLREQLDGAQSRVRRDQITAEQKNLDLEARVKDYEARLMSESKTSYAKLAELEKKQSLEIERICFEADNNKNFLIAANQRLEEIARKQEVELECAKQRILILGGDPNQDPLEPFRNENEALKNEQCRLETANAALRKNLENARHENALLQEEVRMVKRTLDEIRNDLEIKEDENASLRNELAVCRANIARFEGIMGYLEGENKVLKDKVSSLQSELKTEQESARLRLGVASEIAPIPAIEIPDQHQEKLQILRSKVEREKERASRINLSKVSENPTES